MPSACEMFSRRFDLLENIFSIFQGVFARIVKVTHLAQVINFREMAHGKILQRKVDKNNCESTFLLLLLLFFSIQQQNKFLLSLLQTNSKNKKFIVLSF